MKRVIVDTYQAVSGSGNKAVVELEDQVRAYAAGEELEASVYPYPIAFNVLPHIDVFLDNGYTKEEWKVATETRKILHLPDLPVSCTAVRVPVITSHSEAVHVELEGSMTPDEARELFAQVPGVIVRDDPANNVYPLPTEGAGVDEVFVGRIRADASLPAGKGPRLLGRLRQPAQGCRHQCRRDRRAGGPQRLAGARPRSALPEPCDERGARRRTRGHRAARSAPARAAASPRGAPRPSLGRATPTPRWCSWARARARTRTARVGPSSVLPARSCRSCWP